MSVRGEHVPAEVAAPEAGDRSLRALWAAVIAFLVVAVALTWWRLLRGADLVDEAFSVLVPWRWVLGDRPFVDEQNLSQSAGIISYPFVKVFALAGGNDVTGLVLYDRHLYLGLGMLAAGCVALFAKRSVGGPLAVLVAAPFVTVVLFETPQITANTLAALLLSAGAALTAAAILGGPRRYALCGGVAVGLAGVAYPTILLMTPFVAVLLAFSLGERTVLLLARSAAPLPSTTALTASGRRAWRLVSAWVLGGTLVVAPLAATVFAIAGATNLRRCWDYTISLARQLDQLGGTAKAGEITVAFGSLLLDQWYVVLAALAALGVLRVRPRTGRWLLLLTPVAVWVTGTTSGLGVAGAVIVYALSAPYLYLFIPARRRQDGARLLVGVWAPAVVIGTMTAYTSADGLVRAAVGLLAGVVVSGLFLAWGLQPLGRGRHGVSWVAAGGLAAVVVATLAFQVQFLPGDVSATALAARMQDGPWKGIVLSRTQQEVLSTYSADIAREARPHDTMLAYPQAAALYLFWPGEIAANTCQLYVEEPSSALPKATVSYYRRRRAVPTLVTHLLPTAGKTSARLKEECGGLEYPPVVVRPGYAIQRKPAEESVEEVLARLPRL